MLRRIIARFQTFGISLAVAIIIFIAMKAGIFSSVFVESALGVFSPSVAREARYALDSAGARMRGQGTSFDNAKAELRKIYLKRPEWRKTIYCGMEFDTAWKVTLAPGFSCPAALESRMNRVEWEHAVPAENFGRHFQEWRNGGRKNARTNPEFRRMEGDMHNLFPSIGAVNAARSNFRYAMLEGGERPFGVCEAIIRDRAFMPPERARGPVARASLYMAWAYRDTVPGLFSSQQEKLFHAWDRQYPPEDWECERNRMIGSVQGAMNPFVSDACGRPLPPKTEQGRDRS